MFSPLKEKAGFRSLLTNLSTRHVILHWYSATSTWISGKIDQRPKYWVAIFLLVPQFVYFAIIVSGWFLGPPWVSVTGYIAVFVVALEILFFPAVFRGFERAFPQSLKSTPQFLLLFGVAFFCVGAYGLYGKAMELSGSVEAMVVVVDVEAKPEDKGNGFLYRSIFETTTSDGKSMRHAGDVWTYPPRHEKGDIVLGRYSASSGLVASYKVIRSDIGFFSSFSLFGVAAFMLGLYLRRRMKRLTDHTLL